MKNIFWLFLLITFGSYSQQISFEKHYNLGESETGAISIYNVLGEKVSSYKLTTDSNSLNINETELASGVYFYKVYLNDKPVYSDKIIINK